MAHQKQPIFGHFLPAQGQVPFLTVETADSGLKTVTKDILKLDEKLDLMTGVQNDCPTTARGL